MIWLCPCSRSVNKVPCLQGRVTLLLTLFQSLVSVDACPSYAVSQYTFVPKEEALSLFGHVAGLASVCAGASGTPLRSSTWRIFPATLQTHDVNACIVADARLFCATGSYHASGSVI